MVRIRTTISGLKIRQRLTTSVIERDEKRKQKQKEGERQTNSHTHTGRERILSML